MPTRFFDCIFDGLLFFYTRKEGVDNFADLPYNSLMKVTQSAAQKTKRGTIVSLVGIVLNLALACAKITVGIAAGLVSVAADGVNNVSDCGVGIVSLVSFRISAKPADKEHPYGHQRAEYVASLMIAFLVLALAVELFRESVGKILSGEALTGDRGVYLVLAASIAVKAFMFVYYGIWSKIIKSDALKAAAKDSAGDCLATLAVIFGLVVSRFAGVPADGWAGILVCVFIAWEGAGILRDASSKLLGQAPDPALLEKLKALVLAGDGVLGMHDLHIYSYGQDKLFATVHIEMEAHSPPIVMHETLDKIERAAVEELGVQLTAHLDPVDLGDEEARELEQRVRAAVDGMAEGLNVHDFRIVRGATTKVVFEVGIPFSCKTKEDDIRCDVMRAVSILGDYDPVVIVERE